MRPSRLHPTVNRAFLNRMKVALRHGDLAAAAAAFTLYGNPIEREVSPLAAEAFDSPFEVCCQAQPMAQVGPKSSPAI